MMRRLLALTLALAACEDGPAQPSAPPPSRVVAVAAAPQRANAADLCDRKPSADAPAFTWPELASPAPAAPSGGWRWINLWATWCPPCVEELPWVVRLGERLNAQGIPVQVELLSVDSDDDTVAKFATAHSEAKRSLRVRDMDALENWLPKVGLDSGATLPIHLFVDPQGKVRCARTGAVSEADAPAIKALLKGQ